MTNPDPLHHVRKMRGHLSGAAEHLRRDAAAVDDPLFRQMFESSALVLERLIEAFERYEQGCAS